MISKSPKKRSHDGNRNYRDESNNSFSGNKKSTSVKNVDEEDDHFVDDFDDEFEEDYEDTGFESYGNSDDDGDDIGFGPNQRRRGKIRSYRNVRSRSETFATRQGRFGRRQDVDRRSETSNRGQNERSSNSRTIETKRNSNPAGIDESSRKSTRKEITAKGTTSTEKPKLSRATKNKRTSVKSNTVSKRRDRTSSDTGGHITNGKQVRTKGKLLGTSKKERAKASPSNKGSTSSKATVRK